MEYVDKWFRRWSRDPGVWGSILAGQVMYNNNNNNNDDDDDYDDDDDDDDNNNNNKGLFLHSAYPY